MPTKAPCLTSVTSRICNLSTHDGSSASRGPRASVENRLLRVRSLLTAGDLPGARAISDSILAEHPGDAGALIQRSRLESMDDNYRVAREYALSACRVGVRNKRQCMFLLRRLKTFNLIPELHGFIPRIPQELLQDVDVAQLVALFLQTLNKPQLALHHLQLADTHNPSSAPLKSDIGVALLNLGRFEEAEQHFRESLDLQPDHASAWWHLSRLHEKGGADADQVEALKHAIARATDPGNVALLAYALHRELDSLGDHPGATDALEQACTSMRKVVAYSGEEDERLFALLKSLPTEAGHDSGKADAPFTPVFIVGMHRSGTTLLEQLLSGHTDICSGGELYDFTSQLRLAADHHCSTELDAQIVQASPDFDYEAIGRGYLESVDWRRSAGERFVTDKLPSNFLNIGFILRALPGAKILHMSRDPMETCFSNLREPFSGTTCRYSYDQAELANYYRQYFALMQHWRQRFPGRIHDVTYAALATDPAAELKRVMAYLGTGFQPAMLDPQSSTGSVTKASAVQVRQKPGLPLRPKWHAYRDYLTPLAWRLSELGQRY